MFIVLSLSLFRSLFSLIVLLCVWHNRILCSAHITGLTLVFVYRYTLMSVCVYALVFGFVFVRICIWVNRCVFMCLSVFLYVLVEKIARICQRQACLLNYKHSVHTICHGSKHLTLQRLDN